MRRIIGAVIAAIAVAGLVTGCQDDVPTTVPKPPAPGQSTIQATAAPGTETAQATTKAPGSNAPATSGHGLCLDVNSGVVAKAIASLKPAPGGDSFVVEKASDEAVGSCPQLLWVLAATPRGTASSPWHVLFFNHAGYLGTATAKATSYTSVVGWDDRTVQVRYKWLTGNDANCCPSGGPAVITFTLGSDGRKITPNPAIPGEVAK